MVLKAKAENMTKDNIEKAIKRGADPREGGAAYEEYIYEGYGPGGTAVLVEALTDNKMRTSADVRHCFLEAWWQPGRSRKCLLVVFEEGIHLLRQDDC